MDKQRRATTRDEVGYCWDYKNVRIARCVDGKGYDRFSTMQKLIELGLTITEAYVFVSLLMMSGNGLNVLLKIDDVVKQFGDIDGRAVINELCRIGILDFEQVNTDDGHRELFHFAYSTYVAMLVTDYVAKRKKEQNNA